jgi:hypothetical protein
VEKEERRRRGGKGGGLWLQRADSPLLCGLVERNDWSRMTGLSPHLSFSTKPEPSPPGMTAGAPSWPVVVMAAVSLDAGRESWMAVHHFVPEISWKV